MRALGTKNDARYNLKIVDNGPERPERPPRESSSDDGRSSGGLWGEDDNSPSSNSEEAKEVVEEAVASINEDAPEAEAPNSDEKEEVKEDTFSRTRKELADLDDLDV